MIALSTEVSHAFPRLVSPFEASSRSSGSIDRKLHLGHFLLMSLIMLVERCDGRR